MNYYTVSEGIMGFLIRFGITSMIFAIIFLIIHLVFIVYIMRMANEKGQNKLFYGIFAFILPEIAFILLYNKNTYYGDDDYGGY